MTTGALGRRSGWVTFAGITALVAGAYNGLSGLSTLTTDYARIEGVDELLFGINVDAWAWFWLIVGALQILTGVLILMRNPFGQFLGVIIAGLSALTAVFGIFEWPLWAFSVLMLDLLVLYALLTNADDFD
ncbi:MAG TPA: hypothetical protein VE526_13870 [Solirubrobacteraceae bacterium]|jgi:hypothetical protein|nr:hypothetical protein [Solirubrobacteraceae bacterium]